MSAPIVVYEVTGATELGAPTLTLIDSWDVPQVPAIGEQLLLQIEGKNKLFVVQMVTWTLQESGAAVARVLVRQRILY